MVVQDVPTPCHIDTDHNLHRLNCDLKCDLELAGRYGDSGATTEENADSRSVINIHGIIISM